MTLLELLMIPYEKQLAWMAETCKATPEKIDKTITEAALAGNMPKSEVASSTLRAIYAYYVGNYASN
jgi:hypothetical protein